MGQQWISKDQPSYIFLDDSWLRETDDKLFLPFIGARAWISQDLETIPWTKKTIVMRTRDRNDQETL